MSRQSNLPEKEIENIIDVDKIKDDLKPLFDKAEKDGFWFILKNSHILTPSALKEEQERGNLLYPFEDWTLKHPNKILEDCKNKLNESESVLAKTRIEYEQRLTEVRSIQRAIGVVNAKQGEVVKKDECKEKPE